MTFPRLFGCVMLLALAPAASALAQERAASRPFWQVPSVGHPPTANVRLKVRDGHPRCVFLPKDAPAGSRTFAAVRARHRTDTRFRKIMRKALAVEPARQGPAANAACWIVSERDAFAKAALGQLADQRIRRTDTDAYYSDIWDHALASLPLGRYSS